MGDGLKPDCWRGEDVSRWVWDADALFTLAVLLVVLVVLIWGRV